MPGRKPIMACTHAEWRKLCDVARASVPPPEGYSWRFVWSAAVLKRDGNSGDCERKPGKDGKRGTIVIRVARGLSHAETEETLIHELAHGIDRWEHHGWRGPHDATWGGHYARVYCAMRGAATG